MIAIILALLGIYFEESGVPMPVPSEVSLAYLGHRVAAHPLELAVLWVGLTLWILAGSTNLFAASHHFGPRLLQNRLVAVHLSQEQVENASRWLRRWGPLAVMAARFVPGGRFAMAVACGTAGLPYRIYWLSAGLAAAAWSALLLTVGAAVGDPIGRVLVGHPWIVLLFPLPALTLISVTVFRLAHPRGLRPLPRRSPHPARHIPSPGGA